jgi:hypothetical protein
MRLSIDNKAILEVKTISCEHEEMTNADGYNYTVIDLVNGGRIFVKVGPCIYVEHHSLIIEE